MNSRGVLAVAVAVGAVFALGLATLGFAIVAVLGGALTGGGCGGDGGPGGGSQQVGPREWSAEQMTNMQTIVAVAVARGLPRRAAVIAVAAAIVESGLRNLGYGDRDSVGLFQQRPSAGWGTVAEILNPLYATASFYDHLLAVPGWATMPPGTAAQAVQRSAFPDRYAPQEAVAADLVARFWTGPDNPVPSNGPDAADTAALTALTLGCPDQGGSDLPLGPAQLDDLPPGFTLPADPRQRAAVSFALAQVGKPYVWGAKGPDAFDCSGLTQAAYAAAGVALSAGTVSQIHDGSPVASLDAVSPGDLLFTSGSLGSPTNPRHVGMYAGHGVVVVAHSSNRGVILHRIAAWRGKVVAIRHITGPSASAAAS